MEACLKILVVDDDRVDRMTVRRALRQGPVELKEAGDCAAAMAALRSEAFDCAVVDYWLPDGNGLDLVRAARQSGIKVPLIALTGQGDEQIAVELMKAGASDYLSKAKILPDTLYSSIRHAIRIQRAELQAELAAERLRESEERYRLVLQGSNDGIWDWDLAKNEIYWNEAFFEIIGVPRAEFDGTFQAFYERLHPEDQLRVKDALLAHLECGAEYNIEFRLRHASGEYRCCTCRGKAQRNERGMPVRIAGIIRDITERVQAEKQLFMQHRRAQLLAEMTLKIRQSLQIEEILHTTVEEVLHLLGADRVLIYRLRPDGSGMAIAEAVAPDCPSILGQNITDPCFREKYIEQYRQGRISAIGDVQRADIQPCHLEFLQKFGVRANLVVPVLQSEPTIENSQSKRQNRLWGLLIAHQCATARQWTSFEIELLQQLADQVSVALAQAQLLERETQQRQQLAEQNVALERALKNLQKTQAQLIQAEKMSGLGQLVAGIAHEINNPVTFIYGNIKPAQEYIEDLVHLLQLYRQHCRAPAAEIQAATEEIDPDFIISDLNKVLNSMKVGADRIRQIVLSLRNFSRLDEASMKRVDIHEGLDNALLLLQHRLQRKAGHPDITVIKEYGKLPEVECRAGELNQVFVSILNNAIDALEMGHLASGEERGQEKQSPALHARCPTIRIRTEVLDSGWVAVRIADSGPGMTEEVGRRLFDPFFTTKPPGKGTGLGLSISYQIVVEKHQGRLRCVSAPGRGAEFAIEIPIQQQLSTSRYAGDSCPVLLPSVAKAV